MRLRELIVDKLFELARWVDEDVLLQRAEIMLLARDIVERLNANMEKRKPGRPKGSKNKPKVSE